MARHAAFIVLFASGETIALSLEAAEACLAVGEVLLAIGPGAGVVDSERHTAQVVD